jgi:4-amino-4-deoxy-L-arabinose transferase-like glycosyltransferase
LTSSTDVTPESPLRRAFALWPYALVLVVGIFVLVPMLGDYGLWDPWEPKYVESAREMIERGSYIVPYYRDEVRLSKPILVYWGVLAGASVFGLNEFGARIGGVCLALLTMAGVYYTVSRLRGRQAGLISALVLGTAPQFYFIARQAMPDVYLFCSVGMCLLFFCLGLYGGEARRNVHFGISYAWLALAVLAKGPFIIGTLFLTTLAIFTFIHIDLRELWRRERRIGTLLFAGTAIPAAVIVPWLAVAAYLFGTPWLWWGYSNKSREEAAFVRGQFVDSFTRFHLAEIILALVVAAATAFVALVISRGRSRGTLAVGPAVFPTLAAAGAGISLVATETTSKFFAASALGAVACMYVVVIVTWRFLHQDWIQPLIQPYLKPVGRQLLLFLVVFIAIAGPWHLAVFIEQGRGYVTDFIIKHNIHRVEETVNRSGQSDFYLRVLIFGLFPWSCFLPVAIASVVGWWDRNPLKRYGLEIFLLIASLVTFAAFSGPATKFAHYLSPIVVPACVLIGLVVARSIEDRHTMASRLAWIVAAMLFVPPASDLLDKSGPLLSTFTMKVWVPDTLALGAYYKGLLAIVAACLFASILVRSRLLLAGLIAAATLLANYGTATFIPDLTQHKSMKAICDTWKAEAPDGDPPICFYGDIKHGVYFYTENRIQKMRNREALQQFLDPERRAYCIVDRDALTTLRKNYRIRHPGSELRIAEDSHVMWVLLRNFEQ